MHRNQIVTDFIWHMSFTEKLIFIELIFEKRGYMSIRVNLVLPHILNESEVMYLKQEYDLYSIDYCKSTPMLNPLHKDGIIYHIWTEEDDDLLGIASKNRVDTWQKNIMDDSCYRNHLILKYQIDYSIYSANQWMHIIKTLIYDLSMKFVGIFLCFDQCFDKETHVINSIQNKNMFPFQNIQTYNIHDISASLLMDFPGSAIYYFEE